MREKRLSRRGFVKQATLGAAALGVSGMTWTGEKTARVFPGKMEPTEVVRLLNQDITGEIDAILTYMRNAFIIPQCEARCEMEEIGKDEMRHVEWLSGLVTDFGGIPTMEHHELSFGGDSPRDFLKRAIALEKGAIAQYKDHSEQIDHREVVEYLEVILWEEEKHLKEFEELLEDMME
ncbi:MAG: ferritin-like domain-containing protein [Gemmatimonadota bacterium]|nr:MAG: ferritin-like domain-containing protein [Gemmatimonadota bacterium]